MTPGSVVSLIRNTISSHDLMLPSLWPACLQPQDLAHAVADLVLVLGASLAPHLCGFHVCGALVVGLGQHAHDGDEDLLDRLDGRPALGCVLVVVRVVAGGVEDGDADEAAGVDWGVLAMLFAPGDEVTR